MTNFNEMINLESGIIETTYMGKKLVLKNIYRYVGPITFQYLPYGGIQAVIGYHLILNTKNGFIASDFIEYDGIEMSAKYFIETHPDLVNQVLPN